MTCILQVHLDSGCASSSTSASSPTSTRSGTPTSRKRPSPVSSTYKQLSSTRVKKRQRVDNVAVTRMTTVDSSQATRTAGGGTNASRQHHTTQPLAERMRPASLDELMGQSKAFGKGSALRLLIQRDKLSSIVLWGPPGCGKTTVAHIIANSTRKVFRKLSAVTAGVKDVRSIVEKATNCRKLTVRSC